ncbi:hypothetical protein [Lactobacillus helveticus]|uniref:hypothetical protein n=1 Tax=Lactobacillus helveticus TaxID=1587 RepID=UPI00197C6B0C|nr:hypothetical protein [Lactobacillus helveticus]MBN6050075.1 hypothetical protein [Lactobacillus helveticus]
MTEKVLDRSFYSRVENDCSEISVNDLIKLLHHHRIPVANFWEGFGATSTDVLIFQSQITNTYLNKDVAVLQNLWLVLHMLDLYEFADLKILVETIFHKIMHKKTDEYSMQLVAQIALKYLEICFKNKNTIN